MQPVSDRFLASVREAHTIATRCLLWFPGVAEPVEVGVLGGQITIDATAQSRRAGSLQIPFSLERAAQLGVDVRELPLGGYATIEKGIHYPDGERELVTLGHLRVESISWDTLGHAATLELADRMAQVRDEPFTGPFAAAGMSPADAAIAIVAQVFPSGVGFTKPYDPAIILADSFYTGQRTEALTALEQSAAAQTYFDAQGDFVFADREPGPVVWTIDAGSAGVMVSASEDLDRTGIYNGVLMEGQAAADTPPVSALAIHDDPTSPTRWDGPFGKVALVAQSSGVVDAAQALAAAESLLRLRLKMTRSLKLTAAPNPALEAGDAIEVVFPDGREERHQIDAVSTDLAGGAQTIATRSNFEPGAGLLRPRRGRTFMGADAWRMLEDASLVRT